ncbi:MAG: SCO family protein [Bacteroidetes bacterium]|nr:SCO family protein [Bacteroidota bacterium]MCW5897343.1 SCO family protein [Bacteroidota bacterium]
MRSVFVAVVIAVATSLASSQMMDPTKAAARAFTEVGIDQKLHDQIPLDLTFRNEEGDTVKLGSFFHKKPVIISLVYYNCPMLCTQVLNGMVQTFKTLKFTAGQEFDIITVSIDHAESPEMAADKKDTYVTEYARSGVDKGWHFLVGDSLSIKKLADAVGFYFVYDPPTKQFAHASGIMVATPQGKLARYLYGIEYGAKDLTFSLMEAAQEKIGSPVDKLLLLCYHYDPTTGKYGMVVANLLRGGGILMILVLGGYMFLNFRRDKKKALSISKAQLN